MQEGEARRRGGGGESAEEQEEAGAESRAVGGVRERQRRVALERCSKLLTRGADGRRRGDEDEGEDDRCKRH